MTNLKTYVKWAAVATAAFGVVLDEIDAVKESTSEEQRVAEGLSNALRRFQK